MLLHEENAALPPRQQSRFPGAGHYNSSFEVEEVRENTYNACMTPRVSVLVPNYNYAETLPEALDSLEAQSFQDFEVIAVDDGSTDHSLEILDAAAARFPGRFRILTHPGKKNNGLTASYQLGLSSARAPLVAFLEADDVWLPENLAAKFSAFDAHAGVGVVFSRFEPFGEKRAALFWRLYSYLVKLETPVRRPFTALPALLRRNAPASFSHFAVRRELLARVPAPDCRELFFDWWCLAHLALSTDFYYLPEKHTRWRIHRGSANYGAVTEQTIHRLDSFFGSLAASLSENAEGEPQREMIARARTRIRNRARGSRPGFAAWFSPEPLEEMRYAAHVFLKRWMMS